MHLSGQTPLLRAKNLEKYLGIDAIYLKLEGGNPTGHKNDRIAESLVQFASDHGYKRIFVHGTERYMRSILYFAENTSLKIVSPKTKDTLSQQKIYNKVNWLTLKVPPKETLLDYFEKYAQEHNMFFMSEWENKPFIRSLAIQKITEEIYEKLPEPTDIWTQFNGGYTLKSIYHESMRSWVNGSLLKLPKIHCGVKQKVMDRIHEDEKLQEIVTTTRANLFVIDPPMVKEAIKLIKRLEHITVSAEEAYSLAAFIYSEDKHKGTHTIILNDGKNDIDIREISKDPTLNKEEIVAITRKLLEPYDDSVEETSDAVQKAIDVGFIFKATRGNEIHGICIIVHMGFSEFIPSYHLAYIGVLKGNKGRGVATELINHAIEKTGGNLSLHVDIPNSSAKKLYEKMGFVHMYDRMLYKG
jgi:threonine synthase